MKSIASRTNIIKSTGASIRYGEKTTAYKFTQAFYQTYFERSLEYEEYQSLHQTISGILKAKYDSAKAESIREWYDGYHYGDFDVYCPWDVMNYLLELQRNPKAKPVSYWKNTSDNAVIRSFIDYAGSNITGKLETLLAGGTIVQRVDENLTYDYLHSSEENLWSVLYLTGYLTKDIKNPVSRKTKAFLKN